MEVRQNRSTALLVKKQQHSIENKETTFKVNMVN